MDEVKQTQMFGDNGAVPEKKATTSWPKRGAEMIAAGYTYQDRSRCIAKQCRAQIFWFLTPNNRRMP